MTDLATLKPGQIIWSRGRNDYGDGRKGGMVVRPDDNPDTGERFVIILTDSASRPRQDSLLLHRSKGGFTQLGLVARLERMAVADIDPAATDDFRSANKVWRYAVKALLASALPPNDRMGTKAHDALITAYRTLRAEAEMLQRGVV